MSGWMETTCKTEFNSFYLNFIFKCKVIAMLYLFSRNMFSHSPFSESVKSVCFTLRPFLVCFNKFGFNVSVCLNVSVILFQKSTFISWQLEEAKLLRGQGQHEMAISLAKYVSQNFLSNEESSDVHRLVGKWLAETRSSKL